MTDTGRQREDGKGKRNRVKAGWGGVWRGGVWKEMFKSMQGLMFSMPILFTEHVAGLMISRLLATIK